MPRPKKVSNLVKIEKDIVIDAAEFKAMEDSFKKLTEQHDLLMKYSNTTDKENAYLKDELQKVLNENKELKSQIVKIAVVDTHTRFVRKVDIVKLLKSFGKNEPDLKEWEIAITDKDITLKVTTLSNIHYEMSLNEAQQYQL